MTEKVLVNREALDKLLRYVYQDEERNWGGYQADESLDVYDGYQTPPDHIFWSIRQLCWDAGWLPKVKKPKVKKKKVPIHDP